MNYISIKKLTVFLYVSNKQPQNEVKKIFTMTSKIIKYGRNAAAAAAKSLQSCPTLCDPIDSSPPGSSVPRILWARIPKWVAISFSNAC